MKLGIGIAVAIFSSVLSGGVLSGCCEPPPPRHVVVTCVEGSDAGAPEPFEADQSSESLSGSTVCARSCKNLSKLGCPEAWKLPAGRTCTETCKAITSISSYDPLCVEKAKDVAAVRQCPQIACKKD